LWFTNFGNDSIGRITTAGVVSNYTDPTISAPIDITPGPDGAPWFENTKNHLIGRITTSGVVSSFTVPGIAVLGELTAGPDGAMWFTEINASGGAVGRITVDGVMSSFPSNGHNPAGITSGPDGHLWVTDATKPGRIERFTTSGSETDYFPNVFQPRVITTGPDGAIWLNGAVGGPIGRITTKGSFSSYSDPLISGSAYAVASLITGPDGAMWFTNVDSIGRMSTGKSVVTEPEQGGGGGPVAVSGAGFSAGEPVSVNYLTGSSPASVALCSTTATPTGSYTCAGNIPTTAGNPGTHVIEAIGGTSHTKTKTTFILVG
jgi:virginiamycin B lyase